jgi:hypothetical protein
MTHIPERRDQVREIGPRSAARELARFAIALGRRRPPHSTSTKGPSGRRAPCRDRVQALRAVGSPPATL